MSMSIHFFTHVGAGATEDALPGKHTLEINGEEIVKKWNFMHYHNNQHSACVFSSPLTLTLTLTLTLKPREQDPTRCQELTARIQ